MEARKADRRRSTFSSSKDGSGACGGVSLDLSEREWEVMQVGDLDMKMKMEMSRASGWAEVDNQETTKGTPSLGKRIRSLRR
jgi:hypothetical protein